MKIIHDLNLIYLSSILIGEIGDKSKFKPINPLTRNAHDIVVFVVYIKVTI